MVVVRENSEGEYVNNGGRFGTGRVEEFALQTAVHTRRGIERILRFGFELAGTRRNRLTMITKSNAQRYAFVLWDEILARLGSEYPDPCLSGWKMCPCSDSSTSRTAGTRPPDSAAQHKITGAGVSNDVSGRVPAFLAAKNEPKPEDRLRGRWWPYLLSDQVTSSFQL